MIFKTFDSDIDKISAKWGIFGKSFNDIGNAIVGRIKDINKGFQATDDLIGSIKNSDSVWKRLYPSKETIQSQMIDIDALYPEKTDAQFTKLLSTLTQQQNLINTTKGSWTEYFKNLGEGEKWQIEFVKNTDLQKASLDDVKKSYNSARDAAIAHNAALKQQTLSAKAGQVALKGLAIAGNMLAMWGISELISGLYELSQVSDEVANRAQELGNTFNTTKSDISNYKAQIDDLYKTINDSNSSIEDVTTARQTLMSVQDELIDKYGSEKETVDLITDAINGQSDALDTLTEKQWQATKNEFNNSGFLENISNGINGYSNNIDKMLNEYEDYSVKIDMTSFSKTGKWNGEDTKKALEELKEIGIEISETDYGLPFVELSGTATEVYEKLLVIQNLLSDPNLGASDGFQNSLTSLANSAKDVASDYEEFYNQYVLFEKVFADDNYTESFNKINEAQKAYTEAFASGDNSKINEAIENYSNVVSIAMDEALKNGDNSVVNYFKSMYPDLQSEVDKWKFKTEIIPTFDTKGLNGKNKNDILEMLETDGTQDGEKEFNNIVSSAKEFGIIANDDAKGIEKILDLLVEWEVLQGDISGKASEPSNESSILSEDRLAELEEQADQLSSIINEIQSSYDTLQSAIEEYNTQGYLSLDTLDSLLALDNDYLACLVNENGQLSLNADAMNALAQSKLNEAEASAVAEAMTELQAIANGEAASSTANYISGNASLMQSLALLAGQYDNVANAAMTAAQAQELSAMIEAANAKDSVATARVMSGLNSRLGLIRSTASSIRTRGLGSGSSSSSSGSSSSSSKDAWKEEFEAQYDLLKHNLEMEYITEEQYYTALNALNEKYFANRAEYTDEYRKYQEEVYKGMQNVYKDYIENNMSYLEKALDANKISFGHYSNAVKKMLDDMWREGKISAEQYWSYVQEMLEKQLDVFDSTLSAVTTLLDDEIDKLQDEIDLLEDKNDALQKQLDDYDGILSAVDKVYQDEIDRLQEEKDLLSDKINAINDANDALDLQYRKEQAIIALKRAQEQRNKKLFNGKEFIFTTDQDAIRDAQEELQDIETEELISRLEDEQEIIQNSIDVLEEYRQKWQEITDCYDTELNRQLAIMLFGENYENRILQNRIEDIESFKNDYISIQAQIDDNQSMIDSYNEKIEYYQNLKDQWSAISEAYEKERDRQYAAQVLGAQWESDVLSGRISTLTNFKNEYVALQQAIADAAVASANAVVQANQNAANSIASMPTSIPSGGGGGGSSSGGSGGGSAPSTPIHGYHVVHKLSKGFSTQGEATSKIGSYGGDGVYQDKDDNKWYVYKKEGYSATVFSSYNEAKKSHVYDSVASWVRGIAKYASGTTNAKKGLNLVGENGVETYIDNDGNVSLVTEPSLINMEGGETVKNAKETEELLNADNFVPVETMELPGLNGQIIKMSSNELMERMTNAMPSYSSMVQSAIQMPKYDFTPVSRDNSTSVSIGEIHLHEVNNVDSFANAIIRELPSKISQKLGQ